MKKILIANRGEIVLRIVRTARSMGIRTVAVYSEAEALSPHVKFADEAVNIGTSSAYMSKEGLIKAAKKVGADAIHPGYGFLSENAEFAQLVQDSGLTFIGPSPETIAMMGDKLAAKHLADTHKVPLVPGTDTPLSDVEEGSRIADEIGYPVLLKSAAGGGGKGMRVVNKKQNFERFFKRSKSESKKSFGDDRIFIEKYIASPKHIEIQVMADQHGHVLHLFERECSIQRRHQKVLEEAPSPFMTPELRKKMTSAAIKITKACKYHGAGTVEFLVDTDHSYYFLEMNTRLQVEHPVTEMVTGLDLVKMQIEVAQGKPLSVKQADIKLNGHATELRVYAEDPWHDFAPSTGVLTKYQVPNLPQVRVDDGAEAGEEISIYYDPMLAKVIAHGRDRPASIHWLKCAIRSYHISGIKTTLPFGYFVLEHPSYLDGSYDTHFVEDHFDRRDVNAMLESRAKLAAQLAYRLSRQAAAAPRKISTSSQWWENRLKDS